MPQIGVPDRKDLHMNSGRTMNDSSARRRVGASEISVGHRDDIVIDRDSEKEVYEGELFRLRKESECVKELLNRSLKELKAYQIKFPSAYASVVSDAENDTQLPLFAGSDALSPLLRAYDGRIKELEDIVVSQVTKLEDAAAQMETVVAENNDLRQASLDHVATEHGRNDSSGGGKSNALMSELVSELHERIDILMSENGLLVEQKAALSAELAQNSDELSRRTEELSALSSELLSLQQDHTAATQLVSLVQQERDSAALKVMEYSDAVGRIEGQIDSLKGELTVWQNKATGSEAVIKDLRASIKELKAKHQEDGAIFMRRTKNAEDRVVELHTQLLQKTSESEELSEALRKCKREYASCRSDAEGMLQVMGSLERQVAEFAAKEARVDAVVKEAKGRVEEALRGRDVAVARDAQNQKEIQRLLDDRKARESAKSAEIDEAVEKVRTRMSAAQKALEEELRDVLEKCGALRVSGEKATREHRAMKEQLARWTSAAEDEKRTHESVLRELEGRVEAAVLAREEEARRRSGVQEQNAELRGTIDGLRVQLDAARALAESSRATHDAEVSEIRSNGREVQKELAEKTRLLNRKNKECEDLRAQMDGVDGKSGSGASRDAEEAAIATHKRLVALERAALESETARSHDLVAHNAFVQELKSRHASTCSSLENRVKEARIEVDRINNKLKEAESTLRALTEEKVSLSAQLGDYKGRLVRLQEEAIDSNALIADLNMQLAEHCDVRARGSGGRAAPSASASRAKFGGTASTNRRASAGRAAATSDDSSVNISSSTDMSSGED